MAVISLTDAVVFFDDHDFTADSNQVEGSVDVAVLDATVFGQSWRNVRGGVKSVDVSVAGFWQAGSDTVDEATFADLGTADQVLTVAHSSTEGSVCYFGQGLKADYSLLGQHGELAPFSLRAVGSNGDGLIRGQLALAKTSSISSTGAVGSGVQLGAVASDEYLYAAIHVFPTVGTTITIDVESDDNGSFTSATSRGTLGPITTTGGTWLTRVAGAITDDYFRFNVTAVTGSFTAAGAIGVQ